MNEMIAHHYLANSGSRRSDIDTLRKEHLPVSIIAIGSCRTAVPNHTYRTGRWTSFEPRQQARRRVWSIANANLRTPIGTFVLRVFDVHLLPVRVADVNSSV